MSDFKTKYENIKNARKNLDKISSMTVNTKTEFNISSNSNNSSNTNNASKSEIITKTKLNDNNSNNNTKTEIVKEIVKPKPEVIQQETQQAGKNMFRNLKKRMEEQTQRRLALEQENYNKIKEEKQIEEQKLEKHRLEQQRITEQQKLDDQRLIEQHKNEQQRIIEQQKLAEKRKEIIKSDLVPAESKDSVSVIFHEDSPTKSKSNITQTNIKSNNNTPNNIVSTNTTILQLANSLNMIPVKPTSEPPKIQRQRNNIRHIEIDKEPVSNISNNIATNNPANNPTIKPPTPKAQSRRNSVQLPHPPLQQYQIQTQPQSNNSQSNNTQEKRKYSIPSNNETPHMELFQHKRKDSTPATNIIPTNTKNKIIESRLFKSVHNHTNQQQPTHIGKPVMTQNFITSSFIAQQLQNIPIDNINSVRRNSYNPNNSNNNQLTQNTYNNYNKMSKIGVKTETEESELHKQDDESQPGSDHDSMPELEIQLNKSEPHAQEELEHEDELSESESEDDLESLQKKIKQNPEPEQDEEDDIFVDLESIKDPDFVVYKIDKFKELENLFDMSLSFDITKPANGVKPKDENYLTEEEEEVIIKQITDIHFYMKMEKYKEVYTKCTELLDINTNDKKEYISYRVYNNSHIYNLYRFYIWYILAVSSFKCSYHRNAFIGIYNFINYAPQKFYESKFDEIAEILNAYMKTKVDFNKPLENVKFNEVIIINHNFGSACTLPDNFDIQALVYCAYSRQYGINNMNMYPLNISDTHEFTTPGEDVVKCRINSHYESITTHKHSTQVGIFNSTIYMHRSLTEIYENIIELLYDLGEKSVVYDDDKLYAVLYWKM
jgi:hypothetical protein